jgi:hypothetical protein
MTTVTDLQQFLTKEHPTFHWRCWAEDATSSTDNVYVEATINGRPIPHSPVQIKVSTLDRMGIESTAWLVSNELSPARADIDWDKLAEI